MYEREFLHLGPIPSGKQIDLAYSGLFLRFFPPFLLFASKKDIYHIKI